MDQKQGLPANSEDRSSSDKTVKIHFLFDTCLMPPLDERFEPNTVLWASHTIQPSSWL